MKQWRPDNWEEVKKTAIPHLSRFDGGIDQYISGYETGIEFGADAMLEALFKLAKESPTGTFTIDSRIINIFSGEESDE